MNFVYHAKNMQKITSIKDEILETPDLEELARQNTHWTNRGSPKPLIYFSRSLFPYKHANKYTPNNIIFYISDMQLGSRYILVMKILETASESECISCEEVNVMTSFCKRMIMENVKMTKRVLLMPFFEGDIAKLVSSKIDHLQDDTRLILFKTMLDALLCLMDKGMYYSDIKLEQMLYKYNDSGEMIIKLGDLDVSFEGEMGTICSYRSPTYDPRGPALEYDMVWSVGASMLQSYGNVDNMFWNSKKDVMKEARIYHRRFSKKADSQFFFEIVGSILNADPNNYPSLKEILEKIDKKMHRIGLEIPSE